MRRIWLVLSLIFILLSISSAANADGFAKGIYVTQPTLESTKRLRRLIQQSKAAGIDTFVVDYKYKSKRYRRNIKLLKENNIRYVVRIVVFPNGGNASQVQSQKYWIKKYYLAQRAINMGAQAVQLDYIRYSTVTRRSKQNARDIYNVIKFFDERLAPQNIPLQIDVFGVTAFGEESGIGQNIKLFAPLIDTLCPMVYPSHYEPAGYHSRRPYETIMKSLTAIKAQFGGKTPFKLIPFIEASNYRYRMSRQQKMQYMSEQMRAARDSGSDGWYVWSPENKYNNLFKLLAKK